MRTEHELDDALSRPSPADVEAMARLDGDLLVLGASGKIGPSLARLAQRASAEAGAARRVIGVARFRDSRVRARLEADGVETIACDLLDHQSVARLPDCANIVFMVGQKFGTSYDRPLTWATNVYTAALAAERYREARLVAFSTGNVYPLTPVASGGSQETDPPEPVGEYAQSVLGRERMFEYFSARCGTSIAILRLNYAVELRYGVLRDVADRVFRREPIDLATGYVNVIWQRDACSVALRALGCCASPPLILNVTGVETISIRWLAERFGEALQVEPTFVESERDTALLSDARRCVDLFGPPQVSLHEMIQWVADWVLGRGSSFGKPTHYEERAGRF